MRQFIQHRLKTKILGGGEPSHQKRGQYVKRITDDQLNGGTGSPPAPPLNAVTHNGEYVTYNGEYVTYTP